MSRATGEESISLAIGTVKLRGKIEITMQFIHNLTLIMPKCRMSALIVKLMKVIVFVLADQTLRKLC